MHAQSLFTYMERFMGLPNTMNSDATQTLHLLFRVISDTYPTGKSPTPLLYSYLTHTFTPTLAWPDVLFIVHMGSSAFTVEE